jgi:hypothetical protein
VEALPVDMVQKTKKSSTHTTYTHRVKTKKQWQTFGDGRGDQGKDFETGHLHLELLLGRSFKLKHTLQNAMSILGYWVSDWHLLTYLQGTEAETQPKKCQFSNQLVKMRTTSFNAQGAVSERWLANPLKIPTARCRYCQTHWIFSPVAPLWSPWAFHTQHVLTWPMERNAGALSLKNTQGRKQGQHNQSKQPQNVLLWYPRASLLKWA